MITRRNFFCGVFGGLAASRLPVRIPEVRPIPSPTQDGIEYWNRAYARAAYLMHEAQNHTRGILINIDARLL